MDEPDPPHHLVLGSGGYDAAIDALTRRARDVASHEGAARAADFPHVTGSTPGMS